MSKLSYRYLLSIILIGVLFPLSSCVDEFSADQMEIQQQIYLAGNIEQQYITRVNDTGFTSGDQIGVYIVDYQNDKPGALMVEDNRADNCVLTLNTSGFWQSNNAIYWKDNITPIDVYGYYPYDNSVESVKEYLFHVQQDQSVQGSEGMMSGYEKSDFLWAKKSNISPTGELIHLNFQHRMAGIKVMLQKGDGFDGTEWDKLKRFVTVENTALSAHVDLNTGVATPVQYDGRSIVAAPQGDDIYRAIAVPQTIKGGNSIIGLTIDGTYYSYVRDEDIKLYQGMIHTFNLKVDRKDCGDYSLSLVNESIDAWENDTSSHCFEASAYTIVHCGQGNGSLETCINKTGKNPQEIINLKIVGELRSQDFEFIRKNLNSLHALNIYETTVYGDFLVKKEEPTEVFHDLRENVLPDYALWDMTQLSHLVLPKNLETIGVNALRGIGLARNSTLIIPNTVRVLGTSSLSEIRQGNLIMPDSIEYIGDYALDNNNCTFKVPINNNTWYIGNSALASFSGSESNSSGYFRLPEFIKHLGDYSFFDYGNGLEGEINIPLSINSVPSGVFGSMNFANGTNLKLHDKIVQIQGDAFEGIRFNNRIVWPSHLIAIGDDAFRNCDFLGGIDDLPSGLYNIGKGSFYEAKNMPENLDLPKEVVIVPEYSFKYSDIHTLNITGYTERIESDAFSNCKELTSVKLGRYIEYIGSFAFSNCSSIKNLTVLNPDPPYIENNTFDGLTQERVILEVPVQSINKYRAAPGWNKFKYISAYHELALSIGHITCLEKGITRDMVVKSESAWEVTECPAWCHLSQITSDMRTTEITIKVDPSDCSREGEIVFTLKDSGYKTSCLVNQYIYDKSEDQEIVLQRATEGNKEIPLFIIAEGYTADQITDGTYLDAVLKRFEEFFAIEPYKTYRNYFTVSTSLVVSPEQGISNSQYIVVNKFDTVDDINTGFRCNDSALRQYINDVSSIINDDNIGSSTVLLALNHKTFGGQVNILSDGLTICFIPDSPYDYPYDTRGLVQHYVGGKGFGRLADESISHMDFINACHCFRCNRLEEYYEGAQKGWYGNISLNGSMNMVPWKHIIFDQNYSDIVDIFEGGYYHARGVYRSESQSCMGNYIQYYNTISREIIVRRIMELSGETYTFEKFVRRDSKEGLPK